jgi:hypothetical protein
MPCRGKVYHGLYKHVDGGISPKFCVVLFADLDSDLIVTCLATKHAIGENRTPGCQVKTQRFFIPQETTYFELDTYLELTRVREFTFDEFPDKFGVEYKFTLPPDKTIAIKECLKKLRYELPSHLYPFLAS